MADITVTELSDELRQAIAQLEVSEGLEKVGIDSCGRRRGVGAWIARGWL